MEEKKISGAVVFTGRLLKIEADRVRLSDGVEATREVVHHPGAVTIMAVTAEEELVLVSQFRYATGETLLELPAGVPNKGESGEVAARRELAEETGYQATQMQKLWEGYASPGYSDEKISFYIASGLTRTTTNPDEDERIEVELVDLAACLEMAKFGTIKDNKTLIGIQLAALWQRGEWE
jgi:ADP-ribose pyrophosphatase